jgi:hypothetical protein
MSAFAGGSALSWAGWAAKRKRAAGRAGLQQAETTARLAWAGAAAHGPRSAGGGSGPDQCWAKASTGQIGVRVKRQKEKGFKFQKTLKQSNSNLDLNSNTSKQCTGMYATVNSYISLFN